MEKLRRFIQQNPGIAHVPYFTVRGRSLTPVEALGALVSGLVTEAEIGMDPPEDVWKLTEDYLLRLMTLPEPKPVIMTANGRVLTLEEAIMHVRSKDAIGQEIVQNHSKLLDEMKRRLG